MGRAGICPDCICGRLKRAPQGVRQTMQAVLETAPMRFDPDSSQLHALVLKGVTVLQVVPGLNSGGVERGTVEMVQAIKAVGGVPLVASSGGRMVKLVERAGGRHIQLPLNSKWPWTIWWNSLRLAAVIQREGVDLVHARSRAPAWSALWATRRTGVRFVTTFHGIYGESGRFKRFYNSVMARGQRVIAVSQYVADHLLARYRIDPSLVRVIPRGVDPQVFDPDCALGSRMARLADRWRLSLEDKIVMLPGRLTAWKGGEVLIDALTRLSRRDVRVVLVGGEQGRAGATLLRLAEKLGVRERVCFAGDCDDMPAALALADVVVAPSVRPEAFGRTVIEAQAMRKPVIAADHGGAVETVEPGVTGWRVPPDNPAALARMIDDVLDLPAEERAALGERACEAARSRFSTQAMQMATLNVYAELLNRK